tara:strand:+ start:341 stop:628 length:288 start_codon:yes stop_codon:yes gene_type:complete
MDKILPTNGKEFAFYVLMMLFVTATSIQAIYIHDTAVLLDAKDNHIERLEDTVGYWKETSIENSNSAAFQRERCDAFYDVVGDYIDVTNQIKALK